MLHLLRAPAAGGAGSLRPHEPVRAVRPPVEGDAAVRRRRGLSDLPPPNPNGPSGRASIGIEEFSVSSISEYFDKICKVVRVAE